MINHKSINQKRTDNIMAKRNIKKDKQLSTKHTHQSNIEQQNTLILSSLKYSRGTSSFKLGLFSGKTSSICRVD
jgi:predicted choloylglycine hydrolase